MSHYSKSGSDRLFPPALPPCLLRPLPVANFFFINPFGVSEIDALDNLVFQPFLHVRADRPQVRHAVDNVDRQVEAIDLVENREFQRSINVAFLLISTYVNVLMVLAAIS